VADRLAERAPLEAEAAAAASRGEQVGFHEEGAHQGGPEEHEREDERAGHLAPIGTNSTSDKIEFVSWLYIALLAAAVAVLAAAEWPRLETRLGSDARRRRERARRKASLRVVPTTDEEDFAASVERDLASLPTIEDGERRKR
jgi:hypothetical protein